MTQSCGIIIALPITEVPKRRNLVKKSNRGKKKKQNRGKNLRQLLDATNLTEPFPRKEKGEVRLTGPRGEEKNITGVKKREGGARHRKRRVLLKSRGRRRPSGIRDFGARKCKGVRIRSEKKKKAKHGRTTAEGGG